MLSRPPSRAPIATIGLLFVASLTTLAGCASQPTAYREYRAGPRNTVPIRDQPRSVAPPQRDGAAFEPRDEHRCRRVERPKHVVRMCER